MATKKVLRKVLMVWHPKECPEQHIIIDSALKNALDILRRHEGTEQNKVTITLDWIDDSTGDVAKDVVVARISWAKFKHFKDLKFNENTPEYDDSKDTLPTQEDLDYVEEHSEELEQGEDN